MQRILEEFARGNIAPEPRFFKKDSRYGKAMGLAPDIEEKLMERLSGPDKELFERFIDAQAEVNHLTAVGKFVYGYRLGLIMTAEAFMGVENLYMGSEEV